MSFELAPQETVDALTQLVAAGPTTEYPMILLWDDGREYEVVFADKRPRTAANSTNPSEI
jgi:hypothetical protein